MTQMIKRKNKRQSLKSSAPQYEGRKYGRPKLFRYGEPGHLQRDCRSIVKPVSYTHLDVYKRQDILCPAAGSLSGI